MPDNSNKSVVEKQHKSPRLVAALSLAQRGLMLFPVRENAKVAAIKNWEAKAANDPATLQRWFGDGARNIGVACGPSCVVVVDTDTKRGIDGETNFLALAGGDPIREAELAQGHTLTVQTPAGGFHRYYRYSGDAIRNSAGIVAPGVDVRAAGGYVLAPGSAIDGKPYRLVDGTLEELPDWLAEILMATATTEPRKAAAGVELDDHDKTKRAAEYLLNTASPAIEGSGGDATTVQTAAHLGDIGISASTALDLMAEHYNPRCVPPWDADDLAEKVANAYRYRENEIGCDAIESHFDILPEPTPANDNSISNARHILEGGTLDLAALSGQPIPPREWLVAGWIPAGNVTLLYGDGGTGKSLAAMQLAVAVAAGQSWFGHPATAGRALYLTAEDDETELHRRIADIAGGHGLSLDGLAPNLTAISLAAADPALAVSGERDNIRLTPLWRALKAMVEEMRPRLVVLDTLADIFAGNENVRAQARAFIGKLRAMAIENGAAIVVLAHPSRAGLSTHGNNAAAGSSGSTAWHNSVRSRLLLERAEKGTDMRVLSVVKANYGEVGTEIRLRWHDGTFVVEGGAQADAAEAAEAERVFLDMLDCYTREGRRVGPNEGKNYAPSIFAKDERSGMFDNKALAAAMNRLFASDAIRVSEYGPPSHRRAFIARADAMAEAA